MPILLKDHDPDLDLEPGTTKSDIVAHLYSNKALGYRPKDVHEELEIPHNTAKVTLKRLYDAGILGKTADGYYHALESREDIKRYVASLDQLQQMFAMDDTEPETEQVQAEVGEDELDAEVEELEAELDTDS